MPRANYNLKLELVAPLDWPGSPDATGVIDIRIPLATARNGYGPVIVSGVVQSALFKRPEAVTDVRVELSEQRSVTVPIETKKARGNVTVFFSTRMDTAEVRAELTALSGKLKGNTFRLVGTATIDWASAREWDEADQDATVPDIDPLRPPVQTVHTTAFLRGNAKITTHTLLRDDMPEAKWRELIAYNKAQGYGVMYIYAANEGDYGGQRVEYTPAKRAEWRRRLQAVIDSGARVIMWGCADDSKGLANRTVAEWRAYWGMVHAAVGDQVSEWVTGLEVNEYCGLKKSRDLTAVLKELTGKPVGVHTTGLSAIAYAAGADVFYLQDTSKSAAKVAAAVRSAKSQHPGRVIAAELHLSGETAAARALGDAAIEAGADGVGTGCTAKGAAILAARAAGGASNGGDDAPPSDGVDAPAGLTLTLGKARGRYVQWSPAVDRSDHKAWPIAEGIKGKPDGLLYGRRVGEKTWHKIEWIKQGYQETGLKNAYDDQNDPRYDLGWKPGESVELQIRNTAGKVMADWHNGKWVLR